MANSYRSTSSRRKIQYFAMILALFACTMLVRGVIALPLSGLKESVGKYTIREQSDRLELTEMSQGDVELTSAAVRLLLTGSRGLVICGLWVSASEKQARQEWNEVETEVKVITKLQPHFVIPWLFQSWNLTYNVSVEMDSLRDMYFYIARGINLLAEGESINRNSPDIRYYVAFYYQNKFTVSDKVTTLRCLFDLSCMPQAERDYKTLLKGGQLDLEEFQKFTEKNPLFVRRMRDTVIHYGKDNEGKELTMVLASQPMDVVKFLKENEVIPSRFREDEPNELEDRLKQFPVLPPPFYHDEKEELNPRLPIGDGTADAIRAARVWYRYANEVIPPPDKDPGPPPYGYQDPERKRRLPKQPMLIIFRQGPPRAQSFLAEHLAKEGWFDLDPWIVDAPGAEGNARWFKGDVRIKPTANSKEEWTVAYTMWSEHGKLNGFLLESDPRLYELRNLAEKYARLKGFYVGGMPPSTPTPVELADPELAPSIKANEILRFNGSNLHVTNFKSFLFRAEVERLPECVEARKLFFEAEAAARKSNTNRAKEIYEEVLGSQEKKGKWMMLLEKHSRLREDDSVLTESYETQLRYLRLVLDLEKLTYRKATLTLFDVLRNAGPAASSPYFAATSDLVLLTPWNAALGRVEPLFPPGPLDGVDSNGKEWIPASIQMRAKAALGMVKPAQPPSSSGPANESGPGR